MPRFAFWTRRKSPEDLMNWQATASSVGTREPVKCLEGDPVSKAVDTMHFFGLRRLPVTDRQGRLTGIVTSTDILEFLARGRSPRAPVNDVMSENPWAVEHWSSLYRTLGLFHRYRKGGYPVVDGDTLKGMVTDFDIVKGIRRPLGLSVSAVMTRRPFVVSEDEPIVHASRMMCRGFRRLPVVRDGVLAGILTPHDVINHLKERGRLEGLRNSDKRVRDIMARNVVTVGPDVDAYDAVKLIKGMKIGGLPVTEDGEVVGIITERDIVNLLRP